jgi:pimeloyl-ACP methyl ester carboxylesterase
MRSGLIGLVLAVMLAGPAAAAETVTTIPGAPGPGPSKYDKVFVTKFGPKSAKRVLVLMPGYYGGAGDFTLDAREIVKRVPGLQVWALDRRTQALEDTARFADALAGRISVQQAFDYYLGWLANPAIQPHFQPLDPARFAFAKQWGLSLTLQDVRRVVLSAKRQGKSVILGGHSLGASMTVAYASWDFNGRAGYRDLDGLVLIDGGLLGSFSTPDLAATKKAVIDIDAANALTRNAQTDYLKLRPWHRRGVDLPLYALQTDLTHGAVLRGAKRFIAGSQVPHGRSVLVDASATESHLDPLTAAPDRNRFLQTVVPFLRKLAPSSP